MQWRGWLRTALPARTRTAACSRGARRLMFPTRGLDWHCLMVKVTVLGWNLRLSKSGNIFLPYPPPPPSKHPGLQSPQSTPFPCTRPTFSHVKPLCTQFLLHEIYILECLPATVMSIFREKCLCTPHISIERRRQGRASSRSLQGSRRWRTFPAFLSISRSCSPWEEECLGPRPEHTGLSPPSLPVLRLHLSADQQHLCWFLQAPFGWGFGLPSRSSHEAPRSVHVPPLQGAGGRVCPSALQSQPCPHRGPQAFSYRGRGGGHVLPS